MTLPGMQTAGTILGYQLLERIGAGGYGEVWKAEAPGGLTKAVKFVYGYLSDERAAREQRALDKIKEARHPFLLSLERIDVVEGQLTIVTELADMSLKDRFEQCRDAGRPGIERDELLGYLRDVADALDYLREHHSLQHLDIKPENLLLIGGHGKVGDFGLVKHVRDQTTSLLGGLTPVYAAPEVFDGHPSLSSDQYSLAVVFQEMLTGALPFPGRTPGQLALQHARAEPRLGALDPGDRPILARALAKQPEERFSSCLALIAALTGAGRSQPGLAAAEEQTTPRAAAPLAAPSVETDSDASPRETVSTLAIDRGVAPAPQSAPRAVAQPVDEVEAILAPENLPPLDTSGQTHRLRPTIVVGLGGTACRVLRSLRGRLNDRYGGRPVPALRMLLVDTDVHAIGEAVRGDGRTALQPDETLAAPLRQPREYRDDAGRHLAWLSRRWLYNIPRSLKTQGLRPLGRLALVDHAASLMEQLRRHLAAATDPQAIEASAQTAGILPGDRMPRVYVVASISGGTGGGMVLDVAAMVRKVLVESGFSGASPVCVLMHSTNSCPEEKDMATASAYACLSELHHFRTADGYRGDTACGLASFSDGAGAFRDTYLVPLGEGLDEPQLDKAADAVAEYLYLDIATPAGLFFDAHRAAGDDTNSGFAGSSYLRTFRVTQIGCSQGRLPAVGTDRVCRRVVARWQGNRPAEESHVEQTAAQLAESLALNLDALAAEAYRIVQAALREEPDALFQREVAVHARATPPTWALLRRKLDELLGERRGVGSAEVAPSPLEISVEHALEEAVVRRADAATDWIRQTAGASAEGVAGGRRGAAWFAGHVRSLESEARRRMDLANAQLAELAPQLPDAQTSPQDGRGRVKYSSRQIARFQQQWLAWCQLRLACLVFDCVGRSLAIARQKIAKIGDRTAELTMVLGQLADQFDERGPAGHPLVPAEGGLLETDDPRQAIPRALDAEVGQLAEQVDREIRATLLAERGSWELLERRDLVEQLSGVLRSAARPEVLRTLRQLGATRRMLDADGMPADILATGDRMLGICGGGRRLLVVSPDEELARLAPDGSQDGQPAPSVVMDTDVDLVFCDELERMSVGRAAAMLIDFRADYEEVASRLHTRTDLAWTRFAWLPSAGVQANNEIHVGSEP